jgi:RNA polymerase sigma-70 factor (ECF subfamily)
MNATEYQHEAQRLRPQLQAEARRYLQDADEAEDVVQDVLLKLWLMREEVALPMDALAKVLVRNRCIDRLRRLRPTIDIDSLPLIELTDMQQTVLRLRHIDGMDMADIARLIGSSEVAIRKTLSRARLAVRDIYLKKERQ